MLGKQLAPDPGAAFPANDNGLTQARANMSWRARQSPYNRAQNIMQPMEDAPLQVEAGPLVPLWLDDDKEDLLYVRRVRQGERTVIQGILCDWPKLEEQLLPGIDASIARELERVLRRRGVVVQTGTRYLDLERERDGVRLRVEKEGEQGEVRAQRCLVAVGRQAHTEGLGLEAAGVVSEGGWVVVDERYRTSRPDVLAIGDLIDSPQLAHVAAAEGIAAVEIAVGRRPPGRLDPRTIPACVYCRPEIATVGLNEQQARRAGYDVRVGEFSYRALGRAIATGETEGLVKIVVERRSGEVLGAHVLGEAATDVIAEAVMVMGLEGTVWDFGATIHAHPTFAEGLLEAAMASLGEGINA